MRMIYEETLKFADDYRFIELLPTMLTSIYGKVKCLDVLYAAREYSRSSAGQTIKSIRGYMKDGTLSCREEGKKSAAHGIQSWRRRE